MLARLGLAATAASLSYLAFGPSSGRSVEASAGVAHSGAPGTIHERTFIAIKPDGVQRGLIGEVISRFEKRGYKLVAMKLIHPSEKLAREHYADLSARSFFPGLIKYFTSGPVVAMVWEGPNVIKGGRLLVGATNPNDSLPGSIRGDLCLQVGRNIVHGSDGPDSAQAEISLWFSPAEVFPYERVSERWIYE
jgi:nucleoside-diphosphate kinase